MSDETHAEQLARRLRATSVLGATPSEDWLGLAREAVHSWGALREEYLRHATTAVQKTRAEQRAFEVIAPVLEALRLAPVELPEEARELIADAQRREVLG